MFILKRRIRMSQSKQILQNVWYNSGYPEEPTRITAQTPLTADTRHEIIEFIHTIPEEQKKHVTTVTILEGVNKANSKNYNFDLFERYLSHIFGIKKVGTTTTDRIDTNGNLIK